MSETIADDAPLATAKKQTRAVDQATDALIENKGDTLLSRTVTINRPVGELFSYFRDFANLATFIPRKAAHRPTRASAHFQSVSTSWSTVLTR